MSTLSKEEREKLSLLLPWYANGTLDSEDSRRIEAALAEDDILTREFDLVLEDQAAMIELVSEEEVPISMEARFNAALHTEAREPESVSTPDDAREGMIGRLFASFFPSRPRAYAFAAVALALLVPAIAIFSVVNGNQQPGQYQTASGEEGAASDKDRMLVKFKAGITWTEVDSFLKETRGQIVKGPTADGLYELEFEKDDTSAERMSGETTLFDFVLPAN